MDKTKITMRKILSLIVLTASCTIMIIIAVSGNFNLWALLAYGSGCLAAFAGSLSIKIINNKYLIKHKQ